MANDAVLQVRIDSQLKGEAEELYRQMGTTFSEAVRLFARQSVIRRKLPFEVSEEDSLQMESRAHTHELQRAIANGEDGADGSGFAMFASYADSTLRKRESEAWRDAVIAKHASSDESSISTGNAKVKAVKR